ncbi:MAG: type ISP restriction/modification enzyme [Armatimonadota bacterium]|nr:type ISP restriction/modification enzyme [Armatimonadota bacterium]
MPHWSNVDGVLQVDTSVIAPVPPEVWAFEVSRLKVVASWLEYRVGAGGGKKSSPLDALRPERWTLAFNTELLELLWVIEHTLAVYPRQAELLERILASPLRWADELPPPPDWMREPPSPEVEEGLFEE